MKKTIYGILILTICLQSCTDPFSGRESEPPSENEGTFLTPSDPYTVLFNLERAYNEKIITNFEQCLDTSLFFLHDYLLYVADSDSGWSFAIERSATQNIFSYYRESSASRRISLYLRSMSISDQVEEASAVLWREYQLTTVEGLDSAGPDTMVYVGSARFELVDMGFNLWAISRWSDFHETDSDTESWADFKNGFR